MRSSIKTKKETTKARRQMQSECPVCYEQCTKLSVTCCNGHAVCEKHYLQRCKAIYDEGRLAYGKGKMGQCCPVCRKKVPDREFSTVYLTNRKLVVSEGALKHGGHCVTAENLQWLLDIIHAEKRIPVK